MKYQWIEEHKTCEELSQELGCAVRGITKGDIVVGYEDSTDEEGNPIQVPITRKGIEIEFVEEPTPGQLARLNIRFPTLKCEGVRGFCEAVYDNLDLTGSQKEAFKASQLYGLTQEQLATYIDNNITTLASAKEFLKKLSAVVLWLVKQTKLDG